MPAEMLLTFLGCLIHLAFALAVLVVGHTLSEVLSTVQRYHYSAIPLSCSWMHHTVPVWLQAEAASPRYSTVEETKIPAGAKTEENALDHDLATGPTRKHVLWVRIPAVGYPANSDNVAPSTPALMDHPSEVRNRNSSLAATDSN
jgi:hypothetical protein